MKETFLLRFRFSYYSLFFKADSSCPIFIDVQGQANLLGIVPVSGTVPYTYYRMQYRTVYVLPKRTLFIHAQDGAYKGLVGREVGMKKMSLEQ